MWDPKGQRMVKKQEKIGTQYEARQDAIWQARMKQVAQGTRAGYETVPRTMGVYSRGEMKYFDTEYANNSFNGTTNWTATEYDPTTTVETTPVANPNTFFCPVVGSAINQRIGRECKVYRIKIRGQFTIPAQAAQTAAESPYVIRYIFFQDCQTNGSQAQGEQVMQAPQTAAANMACNSFQSLSNFGRFKVLKDKTIIMQDPSSFNDAAATGAQNGLVRYFKITHNFKTPVPVRFNATNGGTISDIVDNSWHLLVNTTASGSVTQLNYKARVCYKE